MCRGGYKMEMTVEEVREELARASGQITDILNNLLRKTGVKNVSLNLHPLYEIGADPLRYAVVVEAEI
jgi:hypothetical protein